VLDPASSQVAFREIAVAGVVGNEALVGAGVNPGDVVVTAGAPLLRSGQKVRVLDAALAAR
jgi:hypothetical protein